MTELNILLNEIKNICKEKHISYNELSKLTGISISTLSKIMAGIIKDPSVTSMIKITRALGYSIDCLIWNNKDDNNKFPSATPQILQKYNSLNPLGQQKADDYITDLSENPKYTE